MQKKIVLALVIGVAATAGYAQQEPAQEVQEPVVSESAAPQTVSDQIPPADVVAQDQAAQSDSVVVSQAAESIEQTEPTQPVAQEQAVVTPVVESTQAAAPAAPSDAAANTEPVEHAEDLEIKGINTVDVDSEPKGNWLYKRIWWEKAERTYEKIKQLTDKILEARILYFARRTDLDRNTLDPFYLGQGFNQGELTEIITYLTEQFEQERKDGTLDEKERELLAILNEEKKNLEGLQKGIVTVTNIDHAIDDALLKLSEQLNQAKMYEQQAWQSFKAINRELSDKKARELYYGMDTYWRNLNNINTYISGAFSQYFDQLDERIKQEVEKIKATMSVLKEKGIDIQAQAQKLKAAIPTEKEEEAVETQVPSGIMGTLWGWLKAPFTGIANVVSGGLNWITGLFGGGTEEISLARPERSAE